MTHKPRLPGQLLPPSDHYPGLLAHALPNNREIVVLGHGEEAERVLAEAVAEREESNAQAR